MGFESDSLPVRSAMLMAAGLGTRLRPFTDLLPKPLLPVLGVPILQFAIDAVREASVDEICINFHHLPEVTRLGVEQLDWRRLCLREKETPSSPAIANAPRVMLSDESKLLLGSGGGLRAALEHLGDKKPFFWLNADVMTSVDLRALAFAHARNRHAFGAEMTLAILAPEESREGSYREIFLSSSGDRVIGLGEVRRQVPFFMGVAVIEPEALRHLESHRPAEFVPDVLTPSLNRGKVGAFFTRAPWYDIGSPGLWWSTHLELLRGLETGRIPALWRKRIESVNHRVAEFSWRFSATSGWSQKGLSMGPNYWSPSSFETIRSVLAEPRTQIVPRALGPNTILYGAGPGDRVFDGVQRTPGEHRREALGPGIGLGDQWWDAKSPAAPSH
jgi:MurNAc alpha-1-phosphate uridylyltransferase